MPIQAPSWTEFLSCPICCNEFAINHRLPISLGCGHTLCRLCLATLHNRQCPFDQTSITTDVNNLPVNTALLQLVSSSNSNGYDAESAAVNHTPQSVRNLNPEDLRCYKLGKKCIEDLALHLKAVLTNGNFGNMLSRPMQRKLVSLVNCQLMEEEGRVRALRAARSLGERTVTELILQHQNSQQLSSNLWAAVRSRGCQFLGPAMQEEVLKLVLLALQDGSALSRKVLVMFVVQRLEPHFPQASKTSIGHVVQLLYRASCFKVSKREADSSLMQLKDEFRTYDALRREHDAQIVQIATEAGLRIAPDQWSSLLYGDTVHKSHMQSISDKLQTPSSFAQSVQELLIALQRTGDPANLARLHMHLKHLSSIDPTLENVPPTWQELTYSLDAVRQVVLGLVEFVQHHGSRKLQECTVAQGNANPKYKISLCRDLVLRRICPRGTSCTFAHSEEELERYRAKNRKSTKNGASGSCGGQNVLLPKKDFQSHLNHHNSHLVALQSSDETASCAAAGNSPMRYTAAGHIGLGGYGDSTPAMHAFGQSLHHSPIPSTSAMVTAGPPPLPVPSILQRFEAPYGSMSYPHSSSLMPSTNMASSPIAMQNPSGGLGSPRNFTTPLHHLPAGNMTNVNPPKFPGNNSPAMANSVTSNGIYNLLATDLYNTNMLSYFSNGNNNYINNSSIRNTNKNGVVDYSISLSGMKLMPPATPSWEQQQQQQPCVANVDLLTTLNQHSIYLLPDTAYCGKKPNNSNTDVNKGLNGTSAPLCDTYTFKNNFNNTSSNISGYHLRESNNLNKSNPTQPSNAQSPFWNAYNNNLGNVSAENLKEVGPTDQTVASGPVTAAAFRDRDTFVRSDSILDDDATTFEVPSTSASNVNKFGPICPMYKDIGAAAIGSNKTNFLDSWNYAISSNRPSEHSLLELSPPDDRYSVFSNGNDTNLPMQPQLQRTSNSSLGFNKHLGTAVLKIQDMQVSTDKPERSAVGGNKKFDLGLRTFQLMTDVENDNSSVDVKKTTSTDDAFLWDININPPKNIWGDSTSIINPNEMTSASVAKEQQRQQQLMQQQKHQQQQKQHQLQRQQQQQQYNQHQLLRKCRSGDDNIDVSIDRGIMRDIELELSEIVDKVWSTADDSGIKSEESVSCSLNWPSH